MMIFLKNYFSKAQSNFIWINYTSNYALKFLSLLYLKSKVNFLSLNIPITIKNIDKNHHVKNEYLLERFGV